MNRRAVGSVQFMFLGKGRKGPKGCGCGWYGKVW